MLKSNILKVVFFGGILVSPFIPELSRFVFIRIWIEILLVMGILFWRKPVKKVVFDKKLVYLILGFTVIAIISSFTGVDFQKSWVGNYYRGDGLIALLHFVGLFLFLIFGPERSRTGWMEGLAKSVAFSAVGLSLISMVIWVSINMFGRYEIETWVDNGIGLTFGNPNFLAGYLLLSLPLVAQFFGFGALLLAVVIAIILTKSVAGVVGIFLFLMLWFLPKKPILRFAVTLLLITFLTFFGLKYLLDTSVSAESRIRIYTKGALAFAQRPILGYGWANFDHAFESVDWPIHYEDDVYVDKAHSSVLEVAVATGIIGLAIYLSTVLRSFYLLKSQKYLFLTLILAVATSWVNITSISEELIFFCLLAAAVRTDY